MATALVLLISTGLIVLLRGIVIMNLWNWFAVPLGVSMIAFPEALGIGVLVTFLTFRITFTNEELLDSPIYKTPEFKQKKAVYSTVAPIVFSLFSWLFGWLIHTYLM